MQVGDEDLLARVEGVADDGVGLDLGGGHGEVDADAAGVLVGLEGLEGFEYRVASEECQFDEGIVWGGCFVVLWARMDSWETWERRCLRRRLSCCFAAATGEVMMTSSRLWSVESRKGEQFSMNECVNSCKVSVLELVSE